jgi:hypothetical protein
MSSNDEPNSRNILSLASGLRAFSATVHKDSTNSSCTELENSTCWEQSRRHRCAAIAGALADSVLARTTGSLPHAACPNASRSVAVCKQGRWLCWDVTLYQSLQRKRCLATMAGSKGEIASLGSRAEWKLQYDGGHHRARCSHDTRRRRAII